MTDTPETSRPAKSGLDAAAPQHDSASVSRPHMSVSEQVHAADLISRLKELQPQLRPAERRVADAVLEDIEFAVRASSAELARRARVSEPTVTRFSRAMGCEGVRDFKLKLGQSLIVGSMYFREPPRLPDAAKADLPFADLVFDHARAALDRAESQIDDNLIREAIDLIAAARRVIVLGVGGGSTAIAQDTQYRLFRYGINVTAYSDVYLMRMAASTLGNNDVVIAISATGRTQEILGAVQLAQDYHAKVVAITKPNSELARVADTAITIDVPESSNVLKPTASRYAFLVVVDLLATGCAYRLGADAQETLRRIKYNLLNFRHGEVLEPLGD
ncbi:MAG: MurR/RpiR family transcriptional regulator [Hyphomicrobiales bacterium]|nr:MurR/RpiR family transcriptional regulator [Hyphomicrobiales bacterium]